MADSTLRVVIAGDTRNLDRALVRSETQLKKFGRTANEIGARGGLGRSGTLGFLTGAGIGRGGGIAAAAGLSVLALKSVTDAAENAQVILGQTSVAVTDAGLSWDKYGKQVADASLRISRASAFDDEAVLQSFQVFVRGQKNVAKSLVLSQLAADVARGRYTDLASATQLVNKAALGQIGALRRAGIQIDKNATATQALAALQAAYGGAAVRYANSAAGAQDKLRVSLENVRENLGAGLLPTLTLVVGVLDDAITSAEGLGTALNNLPKVIGIDANLNFHIPGGGTIGGLLKNTLFIGPHSLGKLARSFSPKGTPDPSPGAAAFDAQFGLGALTAAGTAGQKGKNNPFRIGKGSAITTQVANRLVIQELDARQSGNRSTLKGVLAKEADFLQNALKDIRLKPGQIVALKQALLGVTEEIKSIDDQIISDANDKKQAATDAKDKIRAAKQKAIEALKSQAQAFADQADAIKSAVLTRFDTQSDKISNNRSLEDAKRHLRLAKQIGGPQGIKFAQREVTDANRAINRQRILDTPFKVSAGPPGPVSTITAGTIVFNINGNQSPEKIADAVIERINKKSKTNASQSRGRLDHHK